MGSRQRKNRVFAPVTMKMIYEAAPRPDDVLEIEGENIADVSLFLIFKKNFISDYYRWKSSWKKPRAHAHLVYYQW